MFKYVTIMFFICCCFNNILAITHKKIDALSYNKIDGEGPTVAMVKKRMKSVCLIEVEYPCGGWVHGTGVCIAPDLILTTRHVLEDSYCVCSAPPEFRMATHRILE